MIEKRLFTRKETAQYLSVANVTLETWAREGIGPKWFKIGPKRVVYDRADIDAWVEESKVSAGK